MGELNTARSTTVAILQSQPNRIVNFRSVGVLDVESFGNVLWVNQVTEQDMVADLLSPRGHLLFPPSPPRFLSSTPGSTCATGNSLVTKKDYWLVSNDVDITDMEPFAITKISSHYRIPWYH